MKQLLLLLVCFATAIAAAQEDMPRENFNRDVLGQMGISQNLSAKVASDATFQEADGSKVAFGDLLGKRPVIVMPMYFECGGVCGISTDSLLKSAIAMDEITVGKDYDVVLLSINPRENPSITEPRWNTVNKLYKREGSTGGWHFLTGDLENIRKFTDSIGFKWVYNAQDGRINHPAGLVVLTKTGEISSYIIDKEFPSAFLRNMIADAKVGKIGKKSEANLIGCITMDAPTQARSSMIENSIRIASAVFAVLVGLWIASMILSERKKKQKMMTGGLA